MKAFRFHRPRSLAAAAEALAETEGAILHAGGVDLLDRMKEGVSESADLVNLRDLPDVEGVALDGEGCVVIGARTTLAGLARSELARRFLPKLAEAAAQAASPQIRNRATIAGNLCQHTRCGYYRHRSFPCLKRGGSRCPVREEGGVQETAAIFANGTCASAHPSSLAPVLGALGVEIHVRRGDEESVIPFEAFWAEDPTQPSDTKLPADALVTHLRVPARGRPQQFGYAEIRQKRAFDWPLVSCGTRLALQDGKVHEASVWLGSAAPTPWRATAVEEALVGKAPSAEHFAEAAARVTDGATPLPGNAYKLQLARVCVRRALESA